MVGLLLVAVVAVWWHWSRRLPTGEDVDERTLIPATAQAFACLRVSELWQSAAIQKALQEQRDPPPGDPAAQLERVLGLRPEQIERLTVVGLDLAQPLGYFIVRTHEPYRQDTLLSRLSARQEWFAGLSYYRGENADGVPAALHFVGPRVVIAGAPAGVERALQVRRVPVTRGPLQELIDRLGEAAPGFAGLQVSEPMRDSLRQSELLRDLAEVRTASASVRVGERIEIDVRGQLPNAEAAARLQQTLPGLITRGRVLLPVLAAMRGGEEGKLLGQLGGLLGKITTEQVGSEVSARLEVDAADAAGWLRRVPAKRP